MIAAGTDWVTLPTTAAANAAARNWPSMLTLTTPARSQSTPHSAPKTSGVASDSVPANWLLTGKGRSRPAAAQVRKPDHDRDAGDGAASGGQSAAQPARDERGRRHQAEHRADRRPCRSRAAGPSAAGPRRRRRTGRTGPRPVVEREPEEQQARRCRSARRWRCRCRRFSADSTRLGDRRPRRRFGSVRWSRGQASLRHRAEPWALRARTKGSSLADQRRAPPRTARSAPAARWSGSAASGRRSAWPGRRRAARRTAARPARCRAAWTGRAARR